MRRICISNTYLFDSRTSTYGIYVCISILIYDKYSSKVTTKC
nr:MAG TPA: hypothetical protein [Caudoviricetes sp.]